MIFLKVKLNQDYKKYRRLVTCQWTFLLEFPPSKSSKLRHISSQCKTVKDTTDIYIYMYIYIYIKFPFKKEIPKNVALQIEINYHDESVLRSTETSIRLSDSSFSIVGISIRILGGAKYMCSDIMQTIIPKKSCSRQEKNLSLFGSCQIKWGSEYGTGSIR